MPKPAILILDDRRERGVNPLARCKVSDLMNRGSYERVSKPRLRYIELNQLGRNGGREGINSNTSTEQHFAGPHDLVRGRPIVCRGDGQERARGVGKLGQAAAKGAFKPLRQRKPSGLTIVGRLDCAGQLHERQWIAGGLSQESGTQIAGKARRLEVQQACRIGIAERWNDVPQSISVSKRKIETLSYCQQQNDGIRTQSP
jgi:hypothetical protein